MHYPKWSIGALLAALMMPCIVAAAAQPPLKIGALLPMTGALQAFGEPVLHGIELARGQINAAGGVLGQPLQVEVGDAQTAPQPGVNAASKLVSVNGVAALVGAMSSGVTIPIAESVSKPNRVLEVSYAATSAAITHLDDGDFLFRTAPSGAYEGVVLAHVVHDKGIAKLAIIYVNNDYGKGLAEAFSRAYEALGGEVLHSVAYEENQASYRADLQAAYGDGGARHLLLIGYVTDGETILRQSLEGGMFDQFILSDGMKAQGMVDNLGARYLEGAFGVTKHAPEGSVAAARFSDAYKQKYGEAPPKPFIDTAYDAVYLIALAAQEAGTTTDSAAIRDALRAVANPPGVEVLPGEFAKAAKLIAAGKDINYTGAAGPQDFDEHGDVTGSFALWAVRDGKITTVKVLDKIAAGGS